MLKIKLIQTGRKNLHHHRIVVQIDREKRQGRILEKIGTYQTQPQPALKINRQLYSQWLQKGAQPTEAVAKLLQDPASKTK